MANQCTYCGSGNRRCAEEALTKEGCCIFHDPDLSKDINLLRDRFQARLADDNEAPLWLEGSVFPDVMSFNRIVFKRGVSFVSAAFHGGQANFLGAEFHGEGAYFRGARFYAQLTNFGLAKFHSQIVDFTACEFLSPQATTFKLASFLGQETHFGGARFRGQRTTFEAARFYSLSTYFLRTEFHSRETSFNSASFEGQTLFKGGEPRQIFLGDNIDLRQITVEKEGKIIFDWVDLSRTQLLEADLSKVRFFDVTWDRPLLWKLGPFHRRSWRSSIKDESCWHEARRNKDERESVDRRYLPHLNRLYRALKTHYRETGEYPLVGHFHYGLMEIQWQQKGAEEEPKRASGLRRKWKKWISWEAAYRFSSGYGEDYAWAALLLIALLGLFATCYWWLGLPTGLCGEAQAKQWLHAFLYSFQVGTLSRISFYEQPKTLAARYLQLTESLLIPVQFGFFLFALRNRFRR